MNRLKRIDNMNSNRKKTIIVGVLFIIGIVAGILSIDPVIDSSDYLVKASANANQVITRALLQFLIAVAYASIPIILYPILRKHNKDLALGFLVFRIIAVVYIFFGWTSILLLLAISQEFVKAGTPDPSYFQTIGELGRIGRDMMNHVAMPLVLSVGNIMFYSLLYKTKLVPQWLSGWGLIATVMGSILGSLLVMFQIIGIITPEYIFLTLPTALLEIVLAIWFIAKGFDSKVMDSIFEKE
ncbi:MAG: DUF4386 domain-containing protein [Bacteroidales bacterium]|nr:DUF4386 domain-containing protein [Bacteroidales bacterium]